jgi:DNA recombination protein RmuC
MQETLFFLILIGIVLGLVIYLSRKSRHDERQSESIKNLEVRLTEMVGQLKEIRGNVNGTSQAMSNQIQSFTKETTQLRDDLKQIHERIKDISSFQDIFRSPKLRGQWGEASLEHIIAEHFPRELYNMPYSFSSGEQVDAILKLPDGRILPIDAKFSSDNFERMINSDSDLEKESHRRDFLRDVKRRVDEIASKYILPSEGTIDFALMYIPAEAIYYEIMFHLREENIGNYAWKKKVVLTSPNTIFLTLRTIEHWFRDTQISRQTSEVLKRLGRVSIDAEKLMEEFKKLGRHLRNASSAYEHSEKRLSLLERRVDNLIEKKEIKQLETKE